MANVLIIDDEPNLLAFLGRQIEDMGHTTVRAGSCAEGLAAMDDPAVDLIVADIYIPDSPGPEEWVDQLNARRGERPLVVITAFPSEDLVDKVKSVGATLLTKPFELVFLNDTLAKLSGSDSND